MRAWHGLARETAVDTRAIMKEMDADCANALQAFQSELELLRHVHGRAYRSHPPLLVPSPPLNRAPLCLSVTHADYFHGCARAFMCFVMLLRCVRALRTCTHAMMPQCFLPERDAQP
jgi:hypothetical protein